MNNRLYGARGISSDKPERARDWVEREGGKIISESEIPQRDGSTLTQFVVQAGERLWYLTPNGSHGYGWMKLPKGTPVEQFAN